MQDPKLDQPPGHATGAGPECWICGADAAVAPEYASIPLHRCPECGFVFADERDAERLRDLYGDEYFEEYPGGEAYRADEGQRRFEARVRRDWVRGMRESGHVLEIGAAGGYFLDEMRQAGYEVHGVEPSVGMAAFARDELGVDVRAGFVEDVELPDGKFDVICAWHVLEHLREPRTALRRLRSVLADDGLLLLEIPNIESTVARRRGTDWFNLDPAHHVAFYNPWNLGVLLESVGLRLDRTTTVSPFSYLRLGRLLKPREIAAYARDTVITRTLPGRPHATRLEMLRAVASIDRE